jgi:hypothetical protein
MKPLRIWLLAVSVAVLTAPAQAQSPVDLLAKQVSAACPQFVGRLTANPNLAATSSARPISDSAVCSCAESRIAADPRLRDSLSGDQQALKAKLQGPSVKSYVLLRMTESMLSCLATEFDASANAVVLPQ